MKVTSGTLIDRATSRQLIGREEDLARLEAALDDVVAEHRVSTVFVEGEAGIGKTRVVQEFASRARAREAVVLIGRCVAHGEQIMPFAPLVEIIADLVTREGADRVLQMAGRSAAQLARVVPSLQPEHSPPPPTRASSSGLFQAMCAVLDGISRQQPLVLIVEDLHWADSSTREMLSLLANQLRGDVLILMTLRTDETPDDAGVVRFVAETGRRSAHHVALTPLSRDQQARQISDILGVPPVKELLDSVYARAEGNPFFAEELLVLGSEADTPATVRDLLLARLDALAPATRQLLRSASVVGRSVPHGLLEAVTGLSGDQLDAALRPAVAGHVLVTDDADGGSYQFRHALLQEAIAGSLLPGEAARMHRRVAQALLDDVSSGQLVSGRVATHWYAAGEGAKALVASVDAAREAENSLAFNEALGHYERALTLVDQLPHGADLLDQPRYRLLWRAAEMAHLSAHPARAAELVRAAIDNVDPAEPLHHGYLYERLGRYLWMSAEGEDALVAYETAMEITPAEPPTSWRAAVLSGYSQVLMLASRFAESAELAQQAIEMTRDMPGARSTEGHARNNLGVSLAQLGRLDEGIAELLVARRIADEEMEDVDDVARAIVNLHSTYFNAGRFREAADVAIQGIEVVEKLGLKRRKGVWCRCDAAEALVMLGEYGTAGIVLEEATSLDPQGIDQVRVDICLGQLLLRTGNLDQALEHLERAREDGSRLLDGQLIGPLFAALVEVLTRLGQHERAAVMAAEGWAKLPDDEDAVFCVPLFAAAAAADRERRPDWAELAEVAVSRCLGETPVARAHVAALRCEIGQQEPGAWVAVAARWDALAAPYHRAEATLRAGAASLTIDRVAAAAHLNDAWSTAQTLGAAGLVGEIEDVARRARIKLASQIAATADRPYGMTPREREILTLVASGRTDRQIGELLFISHRTVERHVSNLLAKLGAARRSELAAVAHRSGLADSVQ